MNTNKEHIRVIITGTLQLVIVFISLICITCAFNTKTTKNDDIYYNNYELVITRPTIKTSISFEEASKHTVDDFKAYDADGNDITDQYKVNSSIINGDKEYPIAHE